MSKAGRGSERSEVERGRGRSNLVRRHIMSTQCGSYSTLGVSTDNDLDDPAKMSSLAIMAELRVRH